MRALRLLVTLAALAASSAAFAQQAPLQAGPWVSGHLPQYTGTGYSQPILRDFGGAAGGPLGTNPTELGLTATSLTNVYPAVNAGTGAYGTNECIYDAPITNATGYHYLCLGANSQGGGLIAYGAGGIASQLPFQFIINGTAVGFGLSQNNAITVGVAAPATGVLNGTPGGLLYDNGGYVGSTLMPTVNGLTANAVGAATAYVITSAVNVNTSGLNHGITIAQTQTGVNPNDALPFENNTIEETADDINAGGQFVLLSHIDHHYGGPNMQGGRETFGVNGYMDAPSNSSNTNRNYVTGTFVITVNGGDGGNSGLAKGAYFASGMEATACGVNDGTGLCSPTSTGATDLLELTDAEFNVAAHAGSSMKLKAIITLVGRYDDVEHGTNEDAMLVFSNNSAAVQWTAGMEIDDANGGFPIASNGYVLYVGAGTPQNVSYGIDLTNSFITYTICSFASANFCVNAIGAVTTPSISSVISTGTFGDPSASWQLVVTDSFPSSGTATPILFQDNMTTGSTGNRLLLAVNQIAGFAQAGDNIIVTEMNGYLCGTTTNLGLCSSSSLAGGGSGNLVVVGADASVYAGSLTTVSAVTVQAVSDIRTNVTRKIGIAIINPTTSTGTGSTTDAGLVIEGAGSVGYGVGIQFGEGTLAVSPTGTFIASTLVGAGMGNYGSFIDFSNSTCSNYQYNGANSGNITIDCSGVIGLTPTTWADTHTCVPGQIMVDSGYIYVCTATNTVKRAALSSF